MSHRQGTHDQCAYRWHIGDSFAGSLRDNFSEGPFSLLFYSRNDKVSFCWEGESMNGTPEVNFVVDIKIEGERGEILLNRSWQVSHLRCKSLVDLVYPADIKRWRYWTYVDVEIRDLTRFGQTFKAARAHRIPVRKEFQRPASSSAAANVEDAKVQSGKQSVPIKPVVKTEQFGPAEDRIVLKPFLSEPTGQPPVKRQKTALLPAPVVSSDVNSARTTAVPSLPAQLFSGGHRLSATNGQHIQVVTAESSELSQLREENLRLKQKLNQNAAEAKLKMAEKTAQLSQLQLKCDRLESKHKTQLADLRIQLRRKSKVIDQIDGELKSITGESKINSKTIDKLNDQLKLKSEKCQKLQTELTVKSEENDRLSIELVEQKTKMEENRRAQKNVRLHYQQDELQGKSEKEVVKLLSLKTLSSTIRLANQLDSDWLMANCFRFVKSGIGNELMWKALRPICADLPDIFAQICAYNDSRKNAKLPKFLFSSGINHVDPTDAVEMPLPVVDYVE